MESGLGLSTAEAKQRLERLQDYFDKIHETVVIADTKGRENNNLLQDPILTATLDEMEKIQKALERIRKAYSETADARREAIEALERIENSTAKEIHNVTGGSI